MTRNINMGKKMGNKKGVLGATLTWMPAFLIIFFMIFVFVIATGAMAGNRAVEKILPGGSPGLTALTGAEGIDANTSMRRDFISIMNQVVEFDGKSMAFKDVVLEVQGAPIEDKKEKFRQLLLEIWRTKPILAKKCATYSIAFGEVAFISKEGISEVHQTMLHETEALQPVSFLLQGKSEAFEIKFYESNCK